MKCHDFHQQISCSSRHLALGMLKSTSMFSIEYPVPSSHVICAHKFPFYRRRTDDNTAKGMETQNEQMASRAEKNKRIFAPAHAHTDPKNGNAKWRENVIIKPSIDGWSLVQAKKNQMWTTQINTCSMNEDLYTAISTGANWKSWGSDNSDAWKIHMKIKFGRSSKRGGEIKMTSRGWMKFDVLTGGVGVNLQFHFFILDSMECCAWLPFSLCSIRWSTCKRQKTPFLFLVDW